MSSLQTREWLPIDFRTTEANRLLRKTGFILQNEVPLRNKAVKNRHGLLT